MPRDSRLGKPGPGMISGRSAAGTTTVGFGDTTIARSRQLKNFKGAMVVVRIENIETVDSKVIILESKRIVASFTTVGI